MKKLSKQLAVMAITGCMVASAIPSYATDYSNTRIQNSKIVFSEETEEDGVNIDDILPVDLEFATGEHDSNTQFEVTYKMDQKDGRKANFNVKNNGDVSVVITINGKGALTIAPGQERYISEDVKNGFWGPKSYTFKAVPARGGGKVNISYKIAQRDN